MRQEIRINDEIKAPMLRIIDAEGQQIGVVPIEEALKLALEAKKDLVEVAPEANPPVCRIMDYGKFRYEQTKKEKESKKRQHAVKIKEVKIRPGIFEHDFQIKLEHIREFLHHGNKVKITLMFRGREMINQEELGNKMIDRLNAELAGVGAIEVKPKLMGRSIIFIIGPTK